jgi:hypothetical protein
MVGENGDKIPPFSMRILPPLESSHAQIQEALDARATYSTPARIAARQGMESLTYIRDSFGRVLSEGTGSSQPARSEDPETSEIADGVREAFMNDTVLPGLDDFAGQISNMFPEDDES